ncbi:MAG: ankyrin repeat domain-containing protein [Nitrospirae bacterium]|nr:ankyrin repeat domain-containing protein [Nitrospirota bacterium]
MRPYIKTIVFLCFIFLIPLMVFGRSPEEARISLGKMNIPYTDEVFLQYVEQGDVVVVKLFLDAGVKSETKYGALYRAVGSGHIDVVKLLLGTGIDVKANKVGIKAVHTAAINGYFDIVKLLIGKGVSIHEKIPGGEGGETLLMSAIRGDNIDIVEFLIEKGVAVNEKNGAGRTALMSASGKGHIDIVKLLLKKGARVNDKNNDGGTALTVALYRKNNIDIVRILLEAGADVNVEVGKDKMTPLLKSLYSPYVEMDVVKALIDKGANVNAQLSDGNTALGIAIFFAHPDVVEVLLSKGADPNRVKNSVGKLKAMVGDNPEFKAEYLRIVELLKKYGVKE